MRLPLYLHNNESLSNDNNAEQHCHNHHPGLRFDKFPEWQENPQKNLDENAKADFLKLFTKAGEYKYLDNALEKYHQRRKKLINTTGGVEYDFKTDWRLISGLGNGHPYETGFIWHRTLGVPYLSGSSIKGVLRSWLTQWEGDIKLAENLFGDDSTTKNPKAGKLIILDAIPKTAPNIELDILNPHYQPYYDKPEKNPPADYYNPIPVYFLTVAPNQEFRFQLQPRIGAYDTTTEQEQIKKDLKTGKEILTNALKNIGAGGKTAVGYGLFTRKETPVDPTEEWERAKLKKENKAGIGFVLEAIHDKKRASIKWDEIKPQIGKLQLSKTKLRNLGKPVGITLNITVRKQGNGYKILALNK